jgi:rSAM/selenodomain-associated transferase 1
MNHQKGFQEEIIIFSRYPQPGLTKTRLIPELGADGAANIQRTMTEQIVQTARQLVHDRQILISLYHDGGSHQQMEQWLGHDLLYHEQTGVDLGQKMMFAFEDAWCRGLRRTVLIGSDCPDIDCQLITDALVALQNNQLVLGPATDGGYYLIGTTSDLPANKLSLLFTDIAWGTSDVFQKTIDRAHDAGITTSILKELHDIDHPRDLTYFHHHPDPQ